MSQEVDELFGQGGGAAAPRVALALGLIGAGLAMTMLGLACSTVPGGIVVLGGWFVVEQDRDRLASGFLPTDAEWTVRMLRSVAFAAIALVILMGLVQFWLFASTSFYELVWGSALQVFEAWRASHAPVVPPAPPPAPTP